MHFLSDELDTYVTNHSENEPELLAQLNAANYETYPGIGISKDEKWSEASFFIVNIDLEAAHSIASQFGQLAFLYGDRERGNELIFTH